MAAVQPFCALQAAKPEIPDTLGREVSLDEVVVKPKKEKYSKKNNPAVDFVERLRRASTLSSPANHDYYSYDRYGRMTLALCPFDSVKLTKGQFEFLKDYVEYSPVSGRSMLPFSVKERASRVYLSDHGQTRKEIVEALKRDGLDDVIDQEQVEKVMEDFLREIDLYQNDVALLQNRFVSPLSSIGPDFYKYYLTDTVTNADGTRWIELSFTPRVNTSYGFLGRLYVAEGDSTMFVRHVKMGFPHNINVNFVDRIAIEQTFERAPDGTRLKTLDDLQVELKLLPGIPGVFGRRVTKFDNHSFAEPGDTEAATLSTLAGDVYVKPQAGAIGADETFWEQVREQGMTVSEKNISSLMVGFQKVRGFRYLLKAVKILGSGYIRTNADFAASRFNIGPIFNMVSHNELEGWRLQLGGMTTHNLSKRLFAEGYVAYGFRDRRWKERLSLEYSFIDKNNLPTAFPIKSIKAIYENDVFYPGQKLNSFGMFFQSWQRSSQNLLGYRRAGTLVYTHELENNLSWGARTSFSQIQASPLLPLRYAGGGDIGHYNKFEATANVRYAPGEKVFDSSLKRMKINDDNWVLGFSATAARLWTPRVNYKKLNFEASVWKRFWFSAFGSLSVDVAGGKTIGAVPFTELATMPVNTSYLIVTGAFALANPMEFVGDLYGKWEVAYEGMGILFSRIPLVSKLKIREVVGTRGWWSALQTKNNPAGNPMVFAFPYPDMTTRMPRPYMEAYVGLDNILSILRVDFVWRLTYRDRPDIDRFGVRLALHISF